MNWYAPHVYVIPEDDADRQLADGFVLHHAVNETRIQVVPPAGGWPHVLKTFRDEYVRKLRDYPLAHVVMLIDFDGQYESRRAAFEVETPHDLGARVFVVGARQAPEALRNALRKSFEEIGTSLAGECRAGEAALWGHEQLEQNAPDLQRLIEAVKPILFGPA